MIATRAGRNEPAAKTQVGRNWEELRLWAEGGDTHSAKAVFNVNPHNFIVVLNESRDNLDADLEHLEQMANG